MNADERDGLAREVKKNLASVGIALDIGGELESKASLPSEGTDGSDTCASDSATEPGDPVTPVAW